MLAYLFKLQTQEIILKTSIWMKESLKQSDDNTETKW